MSSTSGFDATKAKALVGDVWATEIVPELTKYIRIPALSPHFDADWEASGHIDAAVDQYITWISARPVAGMDVSVQRIEGRTPLIVVEVEAFGEPTSEGTLVLYGHLDKQPEMTGWREGLGPWTPVRDGDRLYGRGGGDDGYAGFASLTALEAVQAAGGTHGRCVLLIEASEESGSPDLPAHVDALRDRLGPVDLVVCLDSGCANYSTMWLTTSLRGLVAGTLSVDIVEEGLHSGAAGGIVPSTFRIARSLLDRIEDSATGEVTLSSARVEIPQYRVEEAHAVAVELGSAALESAPYVEGAGPVTDDVTVALINKTWRASLSVIGADGLPSTAAAGNVLRPNTSLQLSIRIPPGTDPDAVAAELTSTLEADPPYGARVRFIPEAGLAGGWNAPALQQWLQDGVEHASQLAFESPARLYGEGGTIPFMGMLGEKFPEAQFVITGVLGPGSNAHGPNEFIDVAYAERLTLAVASIIDAHGTRSVD